MGWGWGVGMGGHRRAGPAGEMPAGRRESLYQPVPGGSRQTNEAGLLRKQASIYLKQANIYLKQASIYLKQAFATQAGSTPLLRKQEARVCFASRKHASASQAGSTHLLRKQEARICYASRKHAAASQAGSRKHASALQAGSRKHASASQAGVYLPPAHRRHLLRQRRPACDLSAGSSPASAARRALASPGWREARQAEPARTRQDATRWVTEAPDL